MLAAAAALCVPAAHASQIIVRDASDVALRVDARGRALLEYDAAGRHHFVVASGAVNALPPTSGQPQVRFSIDYAAARPGVRRLRRSFRGGCAAYDGPALVWLVAACKAPDGSYWAVQAWQRLLPMRGFEPWRSEQRAVELHLSHWTGPLPTLESFPNWTYGGAWQGLFGRLTYDGAPVYGTPAAKSYRRYVYIDTFNSVYGAGWKRDAAKATHLRSGGFCYSFVPQRPPPDYPSTEYRGPGNGARHRVTAAGPGVTPVVQWQGPGLGGYDAVRDRTFNSAFDQLLSGDRVCVRER